MSEVKELSDNDLFNELQTWFRIYRNEGKLNDHERAHFRAVVAECKSRGWLGHYADKEIEEI